MFNLTGITEQLFSLSINQNGFANWWNALNDEAIEWIAKNRIYAETVRYTKKAEFNSAMKSSSTIKNKIISIKSDFNDKDLRASVVLFLNNLYNDLLLLENVYIWGVSYSGSHNVSFLKNFWAMAAEISNIDNANAMCFASDNWDFSVFHPVIEAMCDMVGSEKILNTDILTAGVQDVRTKAYNNILGGRDQDFDAYLKRARENHNFIREDGIMPIFLWSFDRETINKNSSRSIDIDISGTVKELSNSFEKFSELYDLYQALYVARVQYDTYEYFGRFSFLRNYMIKVTYDVISNIDENIADSFRYYASTYNYDGALNIINSIGEG